MPIYSARLPLIVVGNQTVGGTGKTPMVMHLVSSLSQAGFRPAVISKGYGGKYTKQYPIPRQVVETDDPLEVGDEPLMIARQIKAPVIINCDRKKAIQFLEKHYDVDCIISDDGLQDYSIQWDIRIAMVDGERGLGNGLLLPSGPLRETQNYLHKIDFTVVTGKISPNLTRMSYDTNLLFDNYLAINLLSGEKRELSMFSSKNAVAIAGIGNPERFFESIRFFIPKIEEISFADHQLYSAEDFPHDRDILMTSKDAVKFRHEVFDNYWEVPTTVIVDKNFDDKVVASVERLLKKTYQKSHEVL